MPNIRKARLFILFATLLVLAMIPPQNLKAATTPGVVCLEDPGTPVQSGSNCNSGPSSFTGPGPNQTQVSPTQIKVGIFIENSSSLNSFDIILLTDHTVLRPAGIEGFDLFGSVLGQNAKISFECIGGKGPPPIYSTCSPLDTADTIELAASGPTLSIAPTTGLLFIAIYDIVSKTSAGGVNVGFQTGCTNSSVTGGACIVINNGTATPVPETIQTGNFNNQSTPPWVSVALTASQPGPVFPGKTANFTLTFTPQNTWPGEVGCAGNSFCQLYLSWVTDPNVNVCCLNPSTSPLNASSPVSITLGLETYPFTGTFHATIFGEYDSLLLNPNFSIGTLVAPITLTLNVFDYSLSVQPAGPITFESGQSASRVLTVGSLNGFSGNVVVSTRVTSPASGIAITYNGGASAAVSVPPGGKVNVTMSLSSSTPGQYLVQPKGAFGSYYKTPSPVPIAFVQDFKITTNNVTFAPGASGTATVKLSSLPASNSNGFAGSISVSATTSSPNLSVSCAGPVGVSAGGTASSTCSFGSSTTGVYNARINAVSGDGLLTHSASIIVVVAQTQTLTDSFNGVTFSLSSTLVNNTSARAVTGFVQVQATNSTTGTLIFSHNYFVNVTFPGMNQVMPSSRILRFELIVSSLGDGILCSANSASAPSISCFATYNPDVFNMGAVNLQDVGALVLAYGSTPGSPHWNPRYDFALNGIISLTDVSIVVAQYGSPIIA